MNWKRWLKLIITATILTVIAQNVDLGLLATTFLELPRWATVVVVGGYLAGQVVSSLKWSTLARAGGISVSAVEALRAYFIGMFVNCFGLGMVGGDVVRGVLISRGAGTRTLGVTSVIADRAHGLAVLAALGAFSAVVFRPEFLDATLVWLLLFLGVGVCLGWIVGPTVIRVLFSGETSFGARLHRLSGMLTRAPVPLVIITVLSLLFHLLQISLHWVMADALGADIPFSYLLMTVPFINILGSLPISWNGVGVREAGYLFFFSQQQGYLSEEQAVAMGAVWLLAITVSSAVGGAVATLSKEFQWSELRGGSLGSQREWESEFPPSFSESSSSFSPKEG
ncbi:flippase-like domain-containing protein [bacterium]|nr:flippase-like domain-containing protein [bacterium]